MHFLLVFHFLAYYLVVPKRVVTITCSVLQKVKQKKHVGLFLLNF